MGVTVRQKVKGKGNPWWVFVSHDGHRTSRMVGTKPAAEEVATKLSAKLQLNEFDFDRTEPEKIPTFKEYAESFMAGYSKHNHKVSTQENYRIALDRHFLPAFGGMALDCIKKKDIKDFLFAKQGEGLSHGRVQTLNAYLSSILSQAVDDEIIISNPAARTNKFITKPEQLEDSVIPLTWEEKNRLEATVRQYFPVGYPLLLTALRTGARIGELIALEPDDLDFDGMFIDVRRSCVRGRMTSTKSNKARKVDMSPQLADALKGYLTERKEEALRKGWGKPPKTLFYDKNGKILDPRYFAYTVFRRWLKKAGLRRIRFHDLRHTYATLRLQKGDNILDVSKQLGHHDVKITISTYYHWIPGGNKSQVAELDLTDAPNGTLYAPKPANGTVTY